MLMTEKIEKLKEGKNRHLEIIPVKILVYF